MSTKSRNTHPDIASAGDNSRHGADAELSVAEWRKQMITTVHDLKTPVTISLLNLELAELESSTDEIFRYTAIVRRELEMMLDTVSNLIDLEKSAAGFVGDNFSATNIYPIFDQAALRMKALTKDRPEVEIINAIAPDLPLIQADSHKLTRVACNLISNSINHTKSGTIRMVSELKRAENTLTISISDTGSGIRKEQLETIFELFHGESSNPRSSGIGLAYVKSVMEDHGGKVWIDTSVKKGTTVNLDFPIPKFDGN